MNTLKNKVGRLLTPCSRHSSSGAPVVVVVVEYARSSSQLPDGFKRRILWMCWMTYEKLLEYEAENQVEEAEEEGPEPEEPDEEQAERNKMNKTKNIEMQRDRAQSSYHE
jgi:hypothetical protein